MEPINTSDYMPVITLLGLENLDQLAELSVEERRNIFTEHLVADEPLELDRSRILEPEPEECNLRLFVERAGNGKLERRFAEEARQIFYQENEFMMWSTYLDKFLTGDFGDSTSSISVHELVRFITVGLDCIHDDHEQHAQALHETLRFTNLEQLSIEFWGIGAKNGSDLATQRMLRAVSKTMKQIIQRFDHCLTVTKVLQNWRDIAIMSPVRQWATRVYNMRSYWHGPTDEVVKRVKEGAGSFEELMQVQIAAWTDPDFVSHWFDHGDVVW